MKKQFKIVRTVITKHAFRTLCIDQGWCDHADCSQYQFIFAKLDAYQSIGTSELQELAELIVDVTDFGEEETCMERDDYIRSVMSQLSGISFSLFE